MRETFRILFFIRENQLKKNGLATIMIRITINGKQIQFSSKLEIIPSAWNQKENKSMKEPYLYINEHLKRIRNDIKRLYITLSSKMRNVSAERLKLTYLSDGEEMYLSYQFKEQVKIFRSRNGQNISERTVDIYRLTYNRLYEFLRKKYKKNDILIQEIDLMFLEHFYIFLRKEYQCSNNTVIKYMKRFAAIMNFAEKIGLLQVNPFQLFHFRIETKTPVYLTQAEISSISKKELITSRLAKIRDAFIFSCWTGVTFSDLCKVKISDIEFRDEVFWLIITRQKTANISQIPLLDEPLRIINKYHPTFPDVSNDSLLFDMCSNQKTNEYLKEIAELSGIKKNLSFHTARHTFAVLALDHGISLETISRILGHTNIRTTQIYAKVSNQKIKIEMDRMKRI